MSRNGPFGLWMGMTAGESEAPLVDLGQFKFSASSVPKPHSLFAKYILQIAPKAGLSWIKAISTPIQASVFGYELKSAFESMEAKLTAKYGKHVRHDFLMEGSIWNEPQDWMQSVLHMERLLFASWELKHGSSLDASLSGVGLVINATDTSSGVIAIEYSFENSAEADAEIAALEDEVL